MADTNQNGVDDAAEDALEAEAYKARAVSAKFKQQVSYGVGAAMVFGLVGAVATKLFGFAFPAQVAAVGGEVALGTAAAFSLPAVLGLAALGVVGVGLLYLSAHYLSENTVLDQAMQAKLISHAGRAKTKAIEPAIEKVTEPKVSNFPSAALAPEMADAAENSATQNNDVAPQTRITAERELADTMAARAANENTPTEKSAALWEDKLAQRNEAPTATARA
jgi:hypothetical protein